MAAMQRHISPCQHCPHPIQHDLIVRRWRAAERLYGSWRFLAIYLGSGLVGSLTSFGYAVLTGNTNILGVGASGAIFGLGGRTSHRAFPAFDVIPKRLRERIPTSLLPIIVLNLFIAFVTPHVGQTPRHRGPAKRCRPLFPLSRDSILARSARACLNTGRSGPMTIRTKLMLIDGHALVHRAFHAIPELSTSSGELTNAVFGFANIVLKEIAELRPTHIVMAMDRPSPTFRHQALRI